MPSQSFDLIVIGTGSAGAGTAKTCAKEGWDVAIIDFRPFGGTCPLRGCDPKKVLVGAADIIDRNQRMQGKGVDSDATINWQDLMQFKETFTQPIPEATEKDFEDLGITYFHGKASFVDGQTLAVNNTKIYGDNILIATGNKPTPMPIDGFDFLTTSSEFLELDKLPDKIIFVGGGYISFEFAHIAARAEADVEILHQSDQALNGFDNDLVDILLRKTKNIGIDVHLNSEVISISKTNSGFSVRAKQNNKTKEFEADIVVHGAGRVPEIEELDLEKGNIKSEKKGVSVNDYLQSLSNKHVYAAGDCAASDGLPLTPLAGFESNIVTTNILKGNTKKTAYPVQPTAVFTIPHLAAVGLTEEQARKQDLNIEVNFQKTDDWYSSRRTNETHTAYKTIINKDNNEILGAHILGDHSAELINLFALAINQGIKTDELKKMIYAYPTHGSNVSAMI